MKRELSSSLTKFYKFYFPALWSLLIGGGVLSALAKISVEPFLILVFGIWVLGSAYIFWLASRLKNVSIDDLYLYVSNYRKEIRIPLSGIERVKESILSNPPLVTIFLRSLSEFGNKIVFIPPLKLFFRVRPHPVVKEMKEIINQYSGM